MPEHIAEQIHTLLLKNSKTIATAESCTGGLLSSLLTRLSGSSKYFVLGLIVYSNQSKVNILKIPSSIIDKFGAVSEKVALLMAKNVRKLAKTDFGIGITGIAGPTGGAGQKPVGTVFISLVTQELSDCKKFIFKGSRAAIRKKSAFKSLELLREYLRKCSK